MLKLHKYEEGLKPVRYTATLAATLAVALFFSVIGSVSANHDPDTDHDGFISVAEGVPFYGGIVHSLTTSGDTNASSALALDRFPVSDEDGEYEYERTFEFSNTIEDFTKLHVVIHGADLNNNDVYDGEKRSSISSTTPFEATVPVACGIVEFDETNEYEVQLNQLNSSGVSGNAEITLSGSTTLMIDMEVEGTSPNIAHAQHFHMGGSNECPPNTIGMNNSDQNDDEEEEEDEKEDDNEDESNNPRVRAYERVIASLERAIERLQDRIQQIQSRINQIR